MGTEIQLGAGESTKIVEVYWELWQRRSKSLPVTVNNKKWMLFDYTIVWLTIYCAETRLFSLLTGISYYFYNFWLLSFRLHRIPNVKSIKVLITRQNEKLDWSMYLVKVLLKRWSIQDWRWFMVATPSLCEAENPSSSDAKQLSSWKNILETSWI